VKECQGIYQEAGLSGVGETVGKQIMDAWIHTPSAHRFGRLREA
jgi:hypothetical protein